MEDLIHKLREAFGFKLTPMNPGDDGVAFVCFVNLASGDTATAKKLQADYFNATGKRPVNDRRANVAEVGEFMDWLIANHWGEDMPSTAVH